MADAQSLANMRHMLQLAYEGERAAIEATLDGVSLSYMAWLELKASRLMCTPEIMVTSTDNSIKAKIRPFGGG